VTTDDLQAGWHYNMDIRSTLLVLFAAALVFVQSAMVLPI
jgi:hypothetical protein